MLSSFLGHYYTISGKIKHQSYQYENTLAQHLKLKIKSTYATHIASPTQPLELEGIYEPSDLNHSPLLLLLPGLGGHAEAEYLCYTSNLAKKKGWSILRVSHLGTGKSSAGVYHGGSYHEIAQWLNHPALKKHTTYFAIGFSMGGHQLARFCTDPQYKGILDHASACSSPLDLAATQEYIDHFRINLYRKYLLDGLKQMYQRLADPIAPLAQIQRISRIKDWDLHVLCRYFGFESAEDYYHSQSVMRHLDQLHTPLLLVPSQFDPLIPIHAALPDKNYPLLDVRVDQIGGHIFGPDTVNLGIKGQGGNIGQILEAFDRIL